jgi:Fe2+ transport system protein B
MKKQSLYFLLLIFIVLVGFNSCTIKKRLYQPGYHVEWHKINKETKLNQGNIALLPNDKDSMPDVVYESQETIVEELNNSESTQEFETVYASNDENTTNIEIVNSSKHKKTFTNNSKTVASELYKSSIKEETIKSYNLTNGAAKVHWIAIAGFASGILSIFLLIFFAKIFLAILFGIVGLIFSIIALRIIERNPDKFVGKALAISGLICSIITVSGFILFYLFLFMILL